MSFLPEVINTRRKWKSAFEEAVNAIRLLGKSDIFTAVTLCVTEDLCQEDSIKRYLDFVREMDVDEIRVTLPVPQGKLSGRKHKQLYLGAYSLFLKLKEQVDKTAEGPSIFIFSQMENKNFIGCSAGFNYITVNNDGVVTPCVAIPLNFGNVRHKPLQEIYGGMGSFFRSSGSTCYGKRLNSLLLKEAINPAEIPFPEETSLEIASKCVVDQQIGGGLRDGASVAVEARVRNFAVRVHAQVNLDVVAAQGIIVRERDVVRVQFAPVGGVLVVFDDDFAVEIVH